jgi:hypothetical protein
MTRIQRDERITDAELTVLARKLTEWISGLASKEQDLVRLMIARAASRDSGDVQGYDISSMMNNNLVFLALQTKVQNASQSSQLMSNLAQTDADAKLNAVRNVRS